MRENRIGKCWYLLHIFVFLFIALPANTQAPFLRFEHLDREDGLINNYVEGIEQDKDGFLWFATQEGVSRYDGTQFVNYTNAYVNKTIVPLKNAYELLVDRENNLWVASLSNGIYRYNREKDIFTCYMASNYSFSGDGIHMVYQDAAERIWFGSTEGLLLYRPDKDDFDVFLPGTFIRSIAWLDNILWLGTDLNGLIMYDPANHRVIKHFNSETGISGNRVFDIKVRNGTEIWIGTNNGGIQKFNRADTGFYRQEIKLNGQILREDVLNITFTRAGQTFISASNKGLIRLDLSTGKAINYTSDYSNPVGMRANTINCIFEDLDGTIWLSTFAGGVYYFSDKTSQIRQYFSGPERQNFLSHSFVTGLTEDSPGNLWISLDGGGINILDKESMQIKWYTKADGLPNNAVTSICKGTDNDIWACMWAGGICKLTYHDQKIRQTTPSFINQEDPSFKNLKAILVDSDNLLWTANHLESLSIIDLNSRTVYSSDNPGEYPGILFQLSTVSDIYEDSRGIIWIGTYQGLYKYDKKYKLLRRFLTEEVAGDLITTVNILSIAEAMDSTIWLNTRDGVIQYFVEQDSFVHHFQISQLPQAYSLLPDSHSMWLATKDGIINFDLVSGEQHIFDEGFDMNGNTFYEGAAYKSTQGYLCFGGTNGLIMFHPDSIHMNMSAPVVYITDITIGGIKQHPGGSNTVLQTQSYKTQYFELGYRQSVISFSFSALNFLFPEKNQYSYKLEGFDQEWSQASPVNSATYTNLNPGKYTFRVRASNNDNVWNTEGASLSFTIMPPFWQTWWFRFIALSVIFLLISSVYIFRIRQIKIQKDKLEKAVEERTQELREANRQLNTSNATKDKFFSIMAHDLKNPFGAIMGITEMLQIRALEWPREKIANLTTSLYDAVERTYQLLENLLNWSRSQRGLIPFHPVEIYPFEVINSNIELVASAAQKKNINLEIREIPKNISIEADRNMVNAILRNLLTNAIKFTPKSGKISISATLLSDTVQFSISDTGVGMDESKINALFLIEEHNSTPGTEKEQGTGLGLILCKEFIDKHKGTIHVISKLNRGTTFIFELPKKQMPPTD